MTLADPGNIGEFVASVVVVLSLIYLATQVRQNSRLLRASAIQSAASNTASGFVPTLAQSPEASAVATKGLQDFGSLTQAQSTQFYLRTPGGREAWKMWSNLIDQSFVDYVEQELLIKDSERYMMSQPDKYRQCAAAVSIMRTNPATCEI